MTPPVSVPDGFELSEYIDGHTIVTRTDLRGSATIDWEDRCFRLGVASWGIPNGPKRKPSGRGWQQALADAAVEYLRAIE